MQLKEHNYIRLRPSTAKEGAHPVTRKLSGRQLSRRNGGFIALVSAIIISAALLVLVSTASFSGFFGRFNILDSEVKETSYFLAEACVNTAIIKIAQNDNYSGGDYLVVGEGNCEIVSVSSVWPKTIRVQASSSEAYTNLEVAVYESGDDILVDTWKEKPTFY